MTPSKQTNPNEEPKMRRVRNQQVQSNNPALMFARGVESIVSDHMNHPHNLAQPPVSKQQRTATQQDSSGNFFSLLMRQFASN
jgi:hypothetical protein